MDGWMTVLLSSLFGGIRVDVFVLLVHPLQNAVKEGYFFLCENHLFSSRRPSTLHDVLESLSRIPGHAKFSTVKVPEVLWMRSVSIQMDRLESQTLHCFLCSKNSQCCI